jgi:2-hydroxycyclohexanecarboxyl-CoA dehydrogenase
VKGLQGRVALVTGAGRGMGRAIAERLAAEGARVAVTDVDRATAEDTAAALGPAATAVHLDVTNPASVAAAVEKVAGVLGPVDVLVNNAGWDHMAPFLETDPELWDRIIDINLKGTFNCARAVLPGMVERRSGRVVNISSDAGRVGSTGEAVYSAAKAGVVGFTKTLAREMARFRITVNVVCPGPTDTPLLDDLLGQGNERLIDALRRAIPLGRLGQPADVAAAVAFLASDDASYVTGVALPIDGGSTA